MYVRTAIGSSFYILYTQKQLPSAAISRNKKSARRDSNPRPSPWQGDTPPLSHSRTLKITLLLCNCLSDIQI